MDKFLKCINCKKLFTQTIFKKKKSLPICPHCKTYNHERKMRSVWRRNSIRI